MTHTAVTPSPVVVLAERQIDDVLASSFPASDPPSWTLGGAETDPADHAARTSAFAAPVRTWHDGSEAGTADVSVRRSSLRAVASLLGAAGIALLVPVFILLLPLALIYRLMLDITRWPGWLPRFG